jgi:Protein of unknown function (DUF1176)
MHSSLAVIQMMKIGLYALAALTANPFIVGDLEEYGDWFVGCDNFMACHATSMPEEQYQEGNDSAVGDGNLSVSVKAWPVPGSALSIQFAFGPEFDAQKIDAIIGVTIDDRLIDARPEGGNGLWKLDRKASLIFIKEARKARKIALVDQDGAEVAVASLRGLFEALAYIDRQQYRTGTLASLANPGAKRWDHRTVPVMAPQSPIGVASKSEQPPTRVKHDWSLELKALDPCTEYASGAIAEEPIYHRLDYANTLLILPTS